MSRVAGLTDLREPFGDLDLSAFINTASYVVFTRDVGGVPYYYAKNGTTGHIEFSGTDAATVIQAALNGLTAGRTWKETIVLKGYFPLLTGVTLYSYTDFCLQGKLYLSDGAAPNGILMTASGSSYIDIIGGELDGNKAASTGNGIYVINTTYFSIRNIYQHNSKSQGINIETNCEMGEVLGCTVEDNDLGGIYVMDNSSYVNILNNQIKNNVRHGVSLQIGVNTNCIISANKIESNGYAGVVLSGATDNIVSCNEIIDNGDGSAPKQDGVALETNADDNVVSNNIIIGNHNRGIRISNTSHRLLAIGNYVKQNVSYGIELQKTSNCVVDGNILNGNDLANVIVWGSIGLEADYNIITNNNCLNLVGGYDVRINNAQARYTLVLGNTLTSIVGTLLNSGTGSKIQNNIGYVTENRVSATITAAATSQVVAHGCSYTPSAGDIHPTLTNLPTNDIGDVWVSGLGAVNMTINCRNVPGAATAIFDVEIRRTP